MIYIYIYIHIHGSYILSPLSKNHQKGFVAVFLVHVYFCCVSKVQTRIAAELGPSSSLILDVPKWLLLNSCRFPDQGICVDQKVLGSL